MHAAAGKHVGADQFIDGAQQRRAAADLVCQRRQAQVHALAGITLRLPIERLMLSVLLEHIMASRLGPAKPRGSTWKGAGACEIASQARQVNFSRTCWITFHCRGTTSSVSVTSSPSLASLLEPQHAQIVGPGTTTRSRGRSAGNGLREGFLR